MDKTEAIEWIGLETSAKKIEEVESRGEDALPYVKEALEVAKRCIRESIMRDRMIAKLKK